MTDGIDSYLKFYSVGIAADNLTPGSLTLHITPIEKLQFVDGQLKNNPVSHSVTGKDATGASFTANATLDNTIEATWLPFGSNRFTAPDIRRGERVMIWRFNDLDTFYWSDIGWDQKYRKLETVTWVFNGTQDESQSTLTPENSYYVEVSTHKGSITLKTSKANKEKVAYTLQFNAAAGQFTFADDIGHLVYIDSTKHSIYVTNPDATQFMMDKQNFTVNCKDTFALNATKNVQINTQAFSLKAQSADMNITQGFTVEAQSATFTIGEAFNVTGSTITLSASSAITCAAPTITLGDVVITGGNLSCAEASITNQLTAGPIVCAGVTSSQNVTAPNIS